eukprot:gene14864-17048_t
MYLSPHDDGVDTVATCASFDINSPTFAGNNAAPAFKGDFMFDMVANCAHDLKTPLAAIFNSNQLAISILSDLQATLARESPSASAHLLSELELAKSTLETSLNMTEFMKMSINRCMDYTKVKNHSMKLSPKCGTINVAEALELPLKCMMSLDSDQHALLGTEGNGLRQTNSHASSGSTKVGNDFRHMSIDPNLSSIDNYEAHSTSTQSMNALRPGSMSFDNKQMQDLTAETLAQLSEKHRLASTPVTSSSPAPQVSRSGVYIPPLATRNMQNMHFA